MKNNRLRTTPGLRRVAVTTLAATLLATAAAPATGSAATRPDRPELREAMQAFVNSGFTGIQVRVHDERGGWAGSAGTRKRGASAKPPTNGRFRVGSVTKTLTATVVLQLVAEGRIGLDTPAADYLTQFPLDRRITVRMLLQHTSGVFNHTGDTDASEAYVPGITWSGKEWVDNRFRTYLPEDLVRFALSKPLKFTPGTSWSYSNTNYILARLLIEKVTGHSAAEETRRRILRPLGMSGTTVPGTTPEISGPHAHAYYRYEDAGQEKTVDVTRQNPSWVSAGGDMISTTRDLQRFISALMNGKLVPGPLLDQMRTPYPGVGYGLGLFMQDSSTPPVPFPPPSCGVAVVHHNGSVQGYGTLMYSTPDGSKTLTASLNYVDDAAGSVSGPFLAALPKLVNAAFCDEQTSN
ncbi:serine hydrolase domain-containing protein [Nocardioides sp. WG-D5]